MNKRLLYLLVLFTSTAGAQVALKPVALHAPSVQITWDEKEPFVNGFARVLSNNKFSFINSAGNVICAPAFDDARNFVHHLAAVRKGYKWGFIDEAGKAAIPCKYDIAYDFKENITAVFSDKKWSLINAKGETVQSLDITAFYGFNHGIAKIARGNRTGTMNLTGEMTWNNEAFAATTGRAYSPQTSATSDCPDNIDFENGSFLNWKCFTGHVDSVGNTNVITVTPSAPTANRHTLISRTLPSNIDPLGLFPINPPDGSNYAVKLGNTSIGAEAERIQYKVRVPANDSNFSIKYDYAVVFQDPGHTEWTQPRFVARLFDSAANAYVPCASFEYISTSTLPGFAASTVDTTVIYKPWASAYISLRAYAGRTMFLEFTTADCVRRGHWGYAYVDVESTCGQSIAMQYTCGSPSTASVTAPPGFQTYNWWSNNFQSVLGTGQQISLNPAPPINSTIWLELIPFNEFGCRDTMPVRFTGSFTPHFTSSEQSATCAPHRFNFYNSDVPSLSAIWDFGDGNSGTGDTVSHVYQLPGIYIVTLNVALPSGCNGIATDTITILQPSGSFSYSGGNFCDTTQVRFDAIVSNIDSLVWDFGDGFSLTTTEVTVYHNYLSAGVYVPHLSINSAAGCHVILTGPDTIKIEKLLAGFSFTQQKICGSTMLNFTDTSHAYFGIVSDAWDFGDGTTGTGNNPSHAYTTTGNYNIQLIVTGATGCKDTVITPVFVKVNDIPFVTINGPTVACGLAPVSFSSTIQSTDSLITILWSAPNGDNSINHSFTTLFTQAGTYNIQLITGTVNGCMDTSVHQITILPIPEVTQPANQSVCNGTTTAGISFSGTPVNASYNWTNDDPSIGLAASGTGNIPSFITINNTTASVISTITVTPVSSGCPGNPSSFTIEVFPTPAVFQPSNQTVCNRGLTVPVIFTNFTSVVTSTGYAWTNDQPGIGLAASGAGNIPSFIAINNTMAPVIATITITPADNGCTGIPQTFTITVSPTADMTQVADIISCNGSSVHVPSFTSPVSGTVYDWTNDNPSIGLGTNGSGDIPSFNAVNLTMFPVIATITVTPVGGICPGAMQVFTITINPTPAVAPPVNQSVCNGSSISAITFSGPVSGTGYNWTNDLPSIGLASNGSGDIPSFTPVNGNTSPVTANISVIPVSGGCSGTSRDFTITILPTANIIQPLNQFLCNGEPSVPVSYVGTVSGTTYSWVNNNTSIGLATNGSGNIPSFIALNNGNTTATAGITVTASANGCPGVSRTFVYFIDPTPDMAQPNNITVCNGTSTAPVNFTGTVAGTGFTWINNLNTVGLAANGSGDIASFIAVNHGHFPVTAIISVTGYANSCSSITKVFTITVNPSPDVDQPDTQELCNGTVSAPVAFTGSMPGTGFSWTNDHPGLGLAAAGTGNIPAFSTINHTNTDIIATITVTGSSNSCSGDPKNFSLVIHPSPVINAGTDRNVCMGSTEPLSATGAWQYAWSPSATLSCAACANPVAMPVDTTQYIVHGTSTFGCIGHDTVILNVIHPFRMEVVPDDTICFGETIRLKASGATGYLWSPAATLNRPDIAEPIATPDSNTTYQVIGYDGYHCFTDTGHVTVTVGKIPGVNIGPDITTTTGTVITFHPVVQNGPIVNWLWTPATDLSCSNCSSPTLTITNNLFYTLTVTNSLGCSASDTVMVNTFCKSAQVFIPNAFTPDGDGLNDILMVRGKGISVKSFRIFNRWGILVFERLNFGANDPKYGWDGKVRGVPATPDVFVYTAEVICDNGTLNTYKGNTTLLK